MRTLFVLGTVAFTAVAVAGIGRTMHTLLTSQEVTVSPLPASQLAELEITAVPARQVVPAPSTEMPQGPRSIRPNSGLEITAAPIAAAPFATPIFPSVNGLIGKRVRHLRDLQRDADHESMPPERRDLFEQAVATLGRQFDLGTPPNSRDIFAILAALERRLVVGGRMTAPQFDEFMTNSRVVLNRNPAKFIRMFREANVQTVAVLADQVAAVADAERETPPNRDPRIQAEARRDAARDSIRESLRTAFKIDRKNELAVARTLVAKHGFSPEQVDKGIQIAERTPEKFSSFLATLPPLEAPVYAQRVQEFVDQTEVDHE